VEEQVMTHRRKPDRSTARDAKPSQITDDYWVGAERKVGAYPDDTERSGKWLVIVPMVQIDEVWAKIKDATEKGLLGSSAKASTARPNPNALNPSEGVICVYTYDAEDKEDVQRILGKLRELGIEARFRYKTDAATRAGLYANRGHKKISKYYK
jgi:hypothetical protein